jgi:hypothetical protein
VIGYSISSSAMVRSVEGIFFAAITAVIAGGDRGLIPGIAPRAWNMRAPEVRRCGNQRSEPAREVEAPGRAKGLQELPAIRALARKLHDAEHPIPGCSPGRSLPLCSWSRVGLQ